MKYFGLTTLILGLYFFSFNSNNSKADKSMIYSEGLNVTEIEKNREEIQKLIRQVLIWSDSKESIELLPVVKDHGDSACFEFDMVKLKSNLDKLKQTGFFASEFIENYNQIIQTIDKKLRNNEFDRWLVGDLPTFNFVNEINPWC